MESVEQGAPGDAGVKTVKRKRAKQSNSELQSELGIKRGQPTVDTRVEHGGKHRVPADHVDFRGADDNNHPEVVRATSAISRDAGTDSPSSDK